MLAVAAATAIANIAKSKGQILDTAAFIKTKALIAIQTAYNAVLGAGTIAAKALRAALVATGVGAVVVAVTWIVNKMQELKEESSGAADEADRVADALERIRLERQEQAFDALSRSQKAELRDLERNIELRKAQGASEVEIAELNIELLEKRRLQLKEIQFDIAQGFVNQEKYTDALEEEKDVVNDLKIARIELNEALAEEARIREEFEKVFEEQAERQVFVFKGVNEILKEQKEFFASIGMEYENVGEAIARVAQEQSDALQRSLDEQEEAALNFFENELDRQEKRKEAIKNLTILSIEAGNQIGQAFSDSLTEAGFQAEEFARRLALLAIDGLEKAILVEIAKIIAKQIAEKGFAGIATGAILSAVVTGAAATAKAALSKPVKFAQGGEFQPLEVGGRLHSQGGTMYVGEDGNRFEVERGEKIFITNRKASSFIGAIAEINKAFGGKGLTGSSSFLRDGGFAANSVAGEVNGQFRTAQLAADIVRGLPEFVVSVSEIDRGLAKVRTVENVVSI